MNKYQGKPENADTNTIDVTKINKIGRDDETFDRDAMSQARTEKLFVIQPRHKG